MRTELILARHGQCDGGEIFRGSTDVLLTKEGWRNMEDALRNLEFDFVISSPLQRCRLFAEGLSKQHQRALKLDVRLQEIHFGLFEGMEIKEAWASHASLLNAWYKNPLQVGLPDAEHFSVFSARVESVFSELIRIYRGKRILVLTHAGVIRTFLSQLLLLPVQHMHVLSVPYACVSKVEYVSRRDRSSVYLREHNLKRQ